MTANRRYEIAVEREVYDHWRAILIERWLARDIKYPFLVREGDDREVIDTGTDLVRRGT